jgi:predicted nucleic acid-binding protein
MILVDTSIWIDHFRSRNANLERLLLSARVLTRPFVIGEIALGVLPGKSTILMNMQRLPQARGAFTNSGSSANGGSLRALLLRHRFRYGASSAKSAAPRRSLAACA